MPIKQKQTIKSQRPSKSPNNFNKLPKQVSEKEFNQYFLPFLSLPKRSRKPKIELWKIFNYILYQMDTGCQWDKLPIRIDPITQKPEINYTSVWRWFDRWSNDKSFEKAFINSVRHLKQKKKLKLKRIHGDGTNSVAKKGVKT
jgi:transposase